MATSKLDFASAFEGAADILALITFDAIDPGCVKTPCFMCSRSADSWLLRGSDEALHWGQGSRAEHAVSGVPEDWIDENNPVQVIDVFIDELDLAELVCSPDEHSENPGCSRYKTPDVASLIRATQAAPGGGLDRWHRLEHAGTTSFGTRSRFVPYLSGEAGD